jgi:hypothetical protein
MGRPLAAFAFTCYFLASLLGAQQGPLMQGPLKEDASANQLAPASLADVRYPLDAFPNFSAVMVGSVLPRDEREFHIYRSGKLLRMEGPGSQAFFLTDLTLLETWAVSARGCLHQPNPYFRAEPFSSARPGLTVERVASGKETVDGHSCQVEDVTISSPKMPRALKLRFWEAEDLQGFPVKVELQRVTGENRVIRYRNVVVGPQDPTLFIHPRHCDSFGGAVPLTSPKAPPAAHTKPAAPSAGDSPK